MILFVQETKIRKGIKIMYNIRIYHECEGRIEKSVPWDHCLSYLGDPEGWIFDRIEKSIPRDRPLSSLGKAE